MPSNIIFALSDFILTIHLATYSPDKNVKAIDAEAVFSEIIIGDICISYTPT
jgi:hypothetical protein